MTEVSDAAAFSLTDAIIMPLFFQMLLSTEDLKMMMDELTDAQPMEAEDNRAGHGTVNLKTFLQIMEKSTW